MARDPGRFWFHASLAAAAFVAAGAAVAADGSSTSSDSADALIEITEPLLANLAAEEARNGPFSPDLIALLTSLGLVYQEHGEDVLAVAVLDRALYLKRVNEGLFGIEQAALLKRLIASQIALGRMATVDELRARLLDLARHNRNDERSAAIFREAAEREVSEYERYLEGDIPASVTIGSIATSPQAIAADGVWRARRLYNEAIRGLMSNPLENKAELADLEEGLARTYYLEASNRARYYVGVDDPLYGLGLGSYQRRVAYAGVGSTGAVDYARALIELADWSLLFSRNGTAVKRYAQVYSILVDQRVSESSMQELFPTNTPVFLPTFAPSPLEGVVVAGSSDYVDVDFEIGKYGQPRKINIVSVEGRDAAVISKQVVAAIGNGRFRPSPVSQGAEYRLRYSLADGRLSPRL